MKYHTVYDALNDMRNLRIPVIAARKLGIYTVPGLVYSDSPVHTDAYYAKKAKELVEMGVDALFIKDASGLLPHTLVLPSTSCKQHIALATRSSVATSRQCNVLQIAAPCTQRKDACVL